MLVYLLFGFEMLCFLLRLRTLIRPNLLVFLLSMLDLFIDAASLPFPPGISMRYTRWYFVHLVVTLYHSDDERQSDIYPPSIMEYFGKSPVKLRVFLSPSLWSCALYCPDLCTSSLTVKTTHPLRKWVRVSGRSLSDFGLIFSEIN